MEVKIQEWELEYSSQTLSANRSGTMLDVYAENLFFQFQAVAVHTTVYQIAFRVNEQSLKFTTKHFSAKENNCLDRQTKFPKGLDSSRQIIIIIIKIWM